MWTLEGYQLAAYRTNGANGPGKTPGMTGSIPTIANAALGLAGEAGEVCDLLKKHLGHGHAIDPQKLAEELGDVLWYVADIATAMNWSLEIIAEMNINKLKRRYPDGFSSEASINRVA